MKEVSGGFVCDSWWQRGGRAIHVNSWADTNGWLPAAQAMVLACTNELLLLFYNRQERPGCLLLIIAQLCHCPQTPHQFLHPLARHRRRAKKLTRVSYKRDFEERQQKGSPQQLEIGSGGGGGIFSTERAGSHGGGGEGSGWERGMHLTA